MYLNRTYEYLDALMTYAKCRNDTQCAGYSSIANVSSMQRKNIVPSFWFAESLKFLYLTFMHNQAGNTFDFEQYVFNTEAHPIPIAWGNDAYLWTEPDSLSVHDVWLFVNIYIISGLAMLIAWYLLVLLCFTKITKKQSMEFAAEDEQDEFEMVLVCHECLVFVEQNFDTVKTHLSEHFAYPRILSEFY